MIKIKVYYRELFWGWCQENDIVCEYMGTSIGGDVGTYMDTWYIGNEPDRMWAVLQWSEA
jgi:hypothetical protein